MHTVLDRARLAVPVILGVATLPGVGLLLVSDIFPSLFPIRAHNLLAAFPLAAVAVAYLAYQAERRPATGEFFKAVLLAMAFLCWAAINSGRHGAKRQPLMTLLSRSSCSIFFW